MESFRLFVYAAVLSLVTAFEIIWNVPSERCRGNASIPVQRFGVAANPNQAFFGPKIMVFYENKLGLYPFIKKDGTHVNGGIPQLVDMDAHLTAVRKHVDQYIPEKNFTGVGVVDWESWRPIWGSNWGAKRVYQKASVAEAKRRYPTASIRALKAKARSSFNRAAKRLMTETLLLLRKLRPGGKWGYYGFPLCHLQSDVRQCSKSLLKYNKNIYLKSTALKEKWTPSTVQLYVQTTVSTALAAASASSDREPIPVYTFVKLSYNAYSDTTPMLAKSDLCSSLKQVADMGGAGALIWSSFYSVRNPTACARFRDYVESLFGPFAMILLDQRAHCATSLCNSHGECVLPPPLPAACSAVTPFSSYACACTPPYTGPRCQWHPNMAFKPVHAFHPFA